MFVDDVRNWIQAALTAGGVPCDVTLNMTNMALTADVLDLDPAFVQAFDLLCMSPDPQDGFKVAVNTWLCADQSYRAVGGSMASKTAVFSNLKSTPQLRSILFFKRGSAKQNNLARLSAINFERFNQGLTHGWPGFPGTHLL